MATPTLTGKTIVIIDAESLLGVGLVELFLSRGANVVANSFHQETSHKREPANNSNLLRTHAQPTSIAKVVQQAVSQFGSIDALINNVAVSHSGSFREVDEPDWRANVLEGLKRAFKAIQGVFPHFKERGSGKIINVCAANGQPSYQYDALKFGLLGLTKTTALEGKKYNIGSFLVAPSTPNLICPDETGEADIFRSDLNALVSTIGALALSKHIDDTGSLFEVSGRRILKLRWQRSMGAVLETGSTLTPTALLGRFEDIVDMSQPEYPTGPADTAKVLARSPKARSSPTEELIGFKNQVVIVTGAGGGLGRAHALLFAQLGASVVVNDLKNSEAVAEEIRNNGGNAVAAPGSATNGAAIVDTAIRTYGRVDVVINNAGVLRDRTLIKMEDSSWDAVLDVHLNGMYQVTKAAWPYFLRQGRGRVVNTTSTSGIYGFFGQGNYSAAKLGMLGLADALAREGAQNNIIVNTIAPIAATAGLAAGLGSSASSEEAEALRPGLISPFVALLASEQAINVSNGGLFELAGGWHSRSVLQRSAGTLFTDSFPPTLDNVCASWSRLTSFDARGAPRQDDASLAALGEVTGKEVERKTYRYDDRDIILYNLSVGAKRADASLIYENSAAFQPLPTFAAITAVEPWLIYHNADLVHDFSDRRALHGEHYLEVLKWPIAPAGTLKTYAKVLDVVDKGNSAVTITGLSTRDAATNQDVFYNEATFFLRGSGGFGGANARRSPIRGPPLSKPPRRPADVVRDHKTTEEQAALYRLTGDRMAMHIDPDFGAEAGFPQPILHGLCFMGIAGYHVFATYGRYASLRVRFSGVVIPGQTLRVEMWRERQEQKDGGADRVIFRATVLETGKSCIEGGVAVLVGEPASRL